MSETVVVDDGMVVLAGCSRLCPEMISEASLVGEVLSPMGQLSKWKPLCLTLGPCADIILGDDIWYSPLDGTLETAASSDPC